MPAAEERPDGLRQTELSIQGMTCASCAARVEKKLGKVGQVSAAVNYATATARVTAPPGVTVQALIDAVESAGYRAEVLAPDDPAEDQHADERPAAYLRRRLILALVSYIPLTDVSLMLSLVPAYRFPGWQWVLAASAAPVVGWAAWPFHKAALAGARHGTASMDTLVSLGVLASAGWSAYAMFALDNGARGRSAWWLLAHASGGGIYLETAATVTTFLLAGRLYEARARRAAGQAMRELAAAGARDVCRLDPDGTEHQVPAGWLRPGDLFVVRPGETIAADGEVVFGQSAALGYLNPVIASAAMTLSSAFVVWNSLRLRRLPLRGSARQRTAAGGQPGRRRPAVTILDQERAETTVAG